jgi:hypothetical protein
VLLALGQHLDHEARQRHDPQRCLGLARVSVQPFTAVPDDVPGDRYNQHCA